MTSSVYIESDLLEHPVARQLLDRLKNRPIVEIKHYGEVFNPKAQNFRLQKANPAIIIARKENRQVLAIPEGYGLGGDHNYYFSHMLNCVYDCRYCFLQGMYRSANQIIFVNFEDFAAQIDTISEQHRGESVWFYSGYDCDSLAFDPMTKFSDYFIPVIEANENAWLELRTKSTQIRSLLNREPVPRVVTAFSFTDQHSHEKLEHGVPTIAKRIDAMKRLIDAGWPVGLRLDPVIYHDDYQNAFRQLLENMFAVIDPLALHSVSLGNFRLTKDHYRKVTRLYPDEPLFAQQLELNNGLVSYPQQLEQEMIGFCESELLRYIPAEIFHPCEWHD
ncbi:MAG: spore photoproduct lyase [Planctomycetota bacterium]|jgi:spore photoproduct lyase